MAVGAKVKGITIEFNGDTTKLGRALKDVNTKSKDVDKALREVNKALKFDPKNTELLAQKQTLLGQKIAQTKEKLEALKKAQATMDADPAVDKQSKEYMELRREIIKTESQLKEFEKEARKLNNIDLTALGNQFKEVGDKMKKAGQGMSKYVTAPLTALAAGTIAAFKEVDEGLDIVIEKTGATGEEAKRFGNIVKDIATDIPTSFEAAGEAVGEVNTRFGITGDALSELSKKFIQFAELNSTDISSSIDTVQKSLSAFGLGTEYAGQLLDRLNLTGQQTGVSMDSLTGGLVQNATAFQEMGLNIDQAVVFMGQMERSGANGETVMQGLRKALKNATADGIPLNQALSDLQNTIKNGTGSVNGLTAAYDLFGKSGDQIYGAVQAGTLDFNAFAAAVEDAGDSVSTTFEETLDPIDKFKTTLNQLKITGADIGATILDLLAPVLEKVAEVLKKINDWWNKLSPGMQKAIVIIGAIVAAIGPLLMVIGSLIGAIGQMLIFGPMIMGMLAPVMGALLPFIPIILAIVAAIVALFLIIKHWDEIKDFLLWVWDGIKKAASVVWEAIKTSITAPIKAVWELLQTIWNATTQFLNAAWNAIKQAASAIWNGIQNVIITPVKKVFETVKNTVEKLRDVVTAGFEAIKSIAQRVWEGIKNAITAPIQKAKEAVQSVINFLKNLFPLRIGKIFDLKLPHFSWDWLNLGGLIRLPKIRVDWYKNGGIFDSPTIAGIGEAGPEAVVPLDKLWEKLDKIAAASSGGGDQIQIIINPTPGMDVNALADEIQRRLVRLQKQREKAWA